MQRTNYKSIRHDDQLLLMKRGADSMSWITCSLGGGLCRARREAVLSPVLKTLRMDCSDM